MNNTIENTHDQFANGQVSCDLRGNSGAAESETQLDAVNVRAGRVVDADERLPGYLREPHLPRLESRRALNFAEHAISVSLDAVC